MVIKITPTRQDRIPERVSTDYVMVERMENYTIRDRDFSYDKDSEEEGGGEGMLVLKNCKNVTVLNCKFHDKSTKGNFITLLGPDSKENTIDQCEFWNHIFSSENGGEPIRIGNSSTSGCEFKTTIKYCYFHDLRADEETVSIKSCGNILQNNRHENCKSSFTIRHGGSNIIKNNVFIGSGGIRAYGENNRITDNVHINNNNGEDDKYQPLRIDNGNLEDDPNFDRRCGDGCSHAVYARAKNNTIEGNTYYNCKDACVYWGFKKREEEEGRCRQDDRIVKRYQLKEFIPPTNNMFEKNTLVVDDGRREVKLAVFTVGGTTSGNTFRANELYGENASRGGFTQEAVERLSSRPEIRIPNVWQPLTEEDLGRLGISGAVLLTQEATK